MRIGNLGLVRLRSCSPGFSSAQQFLDSLKAIKLLTNRLYVSTFLTVDPIKMTSKLQTKMLTNCFLTDCYLLVRSLQNNMTG